jgi:PKD repeat protein
LSGETLPTDPDGDGRYEDVNGDGKFDIVDVQAFFANRNSSAVQNNPNAFDFNGDGSVDSLDVQALFDEFLNQYRPPSCPGSVTIAGQLNF